MLMPKYFDNSIASHSYEILAEIPCALPERHKKWHRESWGCLVCKDKWYRSLPWVSVGAKEDEALFSTLETSEADREDMRRKPRFSSEIKDYWIEHGEEWKGYTFEFYGIEIGESNNPDDYHFWRIKREAYPNLIIYQARMRICYEPQIKTLPIYLEIQYRGYNKQRISIEGLDARSEISMYDLRYLLKARDAYLGFEPQFGIDSHDLQIKLNEFLEAAKRLGEKRLPFSVLSLCQWYGRQSEEKPMLYKTRKPYYDFLKQVQAEEGEKKVEEIKKWLDKKYQDALNSPPPQTQSLI
jgi:hypothetical protein